MAPHIFKGYSVSQMRMLTPEELAHSGAFIGVDGRLTSDSDVVLLAYTGKQDMYGRPIFEHDIVDFDMETELIGSYMRKRGVVKWVDPPGWYTIVVVSTEPEHVGTHNVIVVGNEYPNPYLLKKEPIYPYEVEQALKPKTP